MGTEQISGQTQVCAVITKDASYSLSPLMHNTAYEAAELAGKFIYVGHSVAAEGLKAAIEGIRSLGNYRGLSIGVPHKQAVREYLDEIDQAVSAIGAINTVVIDRKAGNAHLTGLNTDWKGIMTPLKAAILEQSGKTSLKGQKVAVFGAGGAARAAVYGVSQDGADVTIFNRTSSRATELASEFGCQAQSLADLKDLSGFDIILHATNQGMHPGESLVIPPDSIRDGQVLFDFVYSRNIPETDLIKEARRRGAIVIQGREMLLYQGVAQFELFTGREAPVEAMRSVIFQNHTS